MGVVVSLASEEANREPVDELISRSINEHLAIARAFVEGTAVDVLSASEAHLANVEQRMVRDLI
jgi:DNA-binding FadR family transcriptional regulator